MRGQPVASALGQFYHATSDNPQASQSGQNHCQPVVGGFQVNQGGPGLISVNHQASQSGQKCGQPVASEHHQDNQGGQPGASSGGQPGASAGGQPGASALGQQLAHDDQARVSGGQPGASAGGQPGASALGQQLAHDDQARVSAPGLTSDNQQTNQSGQNCGQHVASEYRQVNQGGQSGASSGGQSGASSGGQPGASAGGQPGASASQSALGQQSANQRNVNNDTLQEVLGTPPSPPHLTAARNDQVVEFNGRTKQVSV